MVSPTERVDNSRRSRPAFYGREHGRGRVRRAGLGRRRALLQGRKLLYHELPRAGSANAARGSPSARRAHGGRTSAASACASTTSSWSGSGRPVPGGARALAAGGSLGRGGHLRRARGPRRPAGRAPGGGHVLCREPPSRSSSRATAWSRRAAWAATARSAPTTSAGCSRSRVSSSEPVRGRSRGARGDRAAQGLLPAGRALRARARRGQRPSARRRAHRAPPRARQRPGGAAGVLAPALVRRPLRDQDVPAARLRAGDPLPAPPRGRCARPAGAERGRRPRREPGAARAAAAAGRRAALLPGRVPPRGASSPPARRAGRATRTSSCERRTLGRRAFLAELAAAEGFVLAVYERSRHAVAYAKGTETIADLLALPRRQGAALRLGERQSSRRRAPVPTASPTPTTPTSCARAAPRMSSSARSAGSSGRGGSTSWRPSWARSRACACATRLCPCASWPAAATRRRRRRPRTAGSRASNGWPSSSKSLRRAGRRGSSEDDLPLRFSPRSGPWRRTGSVSGAGRAQTRSGRA